MGSASSNQVSTYQPYYYSSALNKAASGRYYYISPEQAYLAILSAVYNSSTRLKSLRGMPNATLALSSFLPIVDGLRVNRPEIGVYARFELYKQALIVVALHVFHQLKWPIEKELVRVLPESFEEAAADVFDEY